MAVLFQLDSVCVLLFFQLLISSKPTKAHEENQYYMNHSSTENFTIDCDSLVTNSLCGSLTLSQIAENLTNATDIYIDISIAQLQLSGNVEFKYQNFVAITGSGTVISCSERDSGLAFVNVMKTIVVNITLTNCGQPNGNDAYYYAIRLHHCRDIDFINFSALNNSGTAVSILHHHGGTVNFSNCSFINNSIVSDIGRLLGGGGVYIGDFDSDPPISTTYYFTKCSFTGNIAHTRYYHFVYTNEMGESISGYGRGGGVFLAFQKTPLTNIEVVFSECTFSKNKGFIGGGLSVEVQGGKKERAGNISVAVENSLFEANGCACSSKNQTGQGGGMHLSFNTQNK